MNGKDGVCSSLCKWVTNKPPLCGNGIIDLGETCENCPEDVRVCMTRCGNEIIDEHL